MTDLGPPRSPLPGPWLVLLLGLALLGRPAAAHVPTRNLLDVEVSGPSLRVQWHVQLVDLDYALGLDEDADGAITWGEVQARHPAIEAYLLPQLQLEADGERCSAGEVEHLVDDLEDGAYAVLRFPARCPAPPKQLRVGNSFFFDLDEQHRAEVSVRWAEERRDSVLLPGRPSMEVDLGAGGEAAQLRDYLRWGMTATASPLSALLVLAALLGAGVRRDPEGAWVRLPRGDFLLEVLQRVLALLPLATLVLTLFALEKLALPEEPADLLAGGLALVGVGLAVEGTGRRGLRWGAIPLAGIALGVHLAARLLFRGLPGHGAVLAVLGYELGALLTLALWLVVGLLVASALRHREGLAGRILLACGLLLCLLAGLGMEVLL